MTLIRVEQGGGGAALVASAVLNIDVAPTLLDLAGCDSLHGTAQSPELITCPPACVSITSRCALLHRNSNLKTQLHRNSRNFNLKKQ